MRRPPRTLRPPAPARPPPPARPATHRPKLGAAAPTVSASGTGHHRATPTRTPTARPPTTHVPTGTSHPRKHPPSTHPPTHPPTTAHPPRATRSPVPHPPVVVTAPCPPNATILQTAKAANGGGLPPGVRIVGTLCTPRYVAARLTSDAGGGVLLLTRTGATLHVATLGSSVCTNPTVHRAPAVIRRFLYC